MTLPHRIRGARQRDRLDNTFHRGKNQNLIKNMISWIKILVTKQETRDKNLTQNAKHGSFSRWENVNNSLRLASESFTKSEMGVDARHLPQKMGEITRMVDEQIEHVMKLMAEKIFLLSKKKQNKTKQQRQKRKESSALTHDYWLRSFFSSANCQRKRDSQNPRQRSKYAIEEQTKEDTTSTIT